MSSVVSSVGFETENLTCPRCHSDVRFIINPSLTSPMAVDCLQRQLVALSEACINALDGIDVVLRESIGKPFTRQQFVALNSLFGKFHNVKHTLERLQLELELERAKRTGW